VAVAGNAALLWRFHDRFWFAPDEGNYAHVAQRLLAGEVLHRQVQDVHPGYINFLNAAAFRLFGLDLLSLRYPLVIVGLGQALLVFLLLAGQRPLLGLMASLTLTAFGAIQFLNPTAHWYCLALAVAAGAALAWLPRGRRRLIVLGLLVGLLALFRQLSGALVAMGVVSYLLLEAPSEAARGRDRWVGRTLLVSMAAVLALYLGRATDPAGWLLFGIWPLGLLAWLSAKVAVPNREVARIAGWLILGAAVSSLPLWLYHLAHGSVGWWLRDTLQTAMFLGRMNFLDRPLYASLTRTGLLQLFSPHPTEIINGAFWFVLPLLAALQGLLLVASLVRGPARLAPPLSWLAVFYAVVSVHYQIPLYLLYSVGLTLVGLLSLAAELRPRARAAAMIGAGLLAVVAVVFQAGQPLGRGIPGIVEGRRAALVPANPLPRCHLLIEPGERQRYLDLVGLIQAETRPEQAIFVLPSDAELYFLSGRPNPFRFYNTALGISDERALNEAIGVLEAHPPALVIFNPEDKYNTAFSRRLMQVIRQRYALLRRIHGLDIYRLP
jgi:hypothetical protein